jgi:hypothetical protein
MRTRERKVFLDTEFTSLENPKLLSIAMVDEDCASSFYAELDLSCASPSFETLIGDFARAEVVTQFGRLPDTSDSRVGMAERAVRWLNCLVSARLCIVYDYSADYELFDDLLHDSVQVVIPQLVPTHVGYLLHDADGELAAAASFGESAHIGLKRHHALADALALRARFKAVHG